MRVAPARVAHSSATRLAWGFSFVMLLLLGILLVSAANFSGGLSLAFAIAALLPALGIVVAFASLVGVRRQLAAPVAKIDSCVRIFSSGVVFDLSELKLVRVLNSGGTSRMQLLPEHLLGETAGLGPYTVEFPPLAEPTALELADLLAERVPGLQVEKS